MSVHKTVSERYEIRPGKGRWQHDFANINLVCWSRPANVGTPHECTYYCGEIQINSSFGSWGNIWTACGNPFKEFLIDAEFDYVFTKFMGANLFRFDSDAAEKEVLKWITEGRRRGKLSKREAREAWEECDSSFDSLMSQEGFGNAMWQIASGIGRSHQLHDSFADPSGWPHPTKPDIQAVGFWEAIWPEFIEALKAERASPDRGEVK